MQIPKRWRGPLWMLWSCFVFVCAWGLIRLASETMHPFLVVFYRSVFAALAFLPFVVRHRLAVLKTAHFGQHATRGALSFVGTVGLFYAVAHIPLADVVAISYAAPVFGAAGVILILKEKVHWRRIAAILAGFLGVLVVIRPGFQDMTPGLLAAIIGTLSIAGSLVVIKSLSGSDKAEVIALYSFLFVIPPSLILALFYWEWPNPYEFLILAGIGILVALAHTALGRAFSHSEATAVLPIDFSRMVFATLLGTLAFGESIDVIAWAGGGIILASTVYVAHREAVVKRNRKKRAIAPPPCS